MQLPLDVPTLEAASLWALVAAAAFSALVLIRAGGLRPLTDRLRRRFVLGVPWGTVAVVLGVLAVYFLIQGGGQRGGPVVVAFRSWSFSYPLGVVLAPFSHASEGHVTGNLLATVAFAPVAEYVWSHYPIRRGHSSFGSWLRNPFVRIGLFVVGVVLVGLATSAFIPGALIGFSGVVFAFGGFALVTRPLTAVVALVAERAVSLGYQALQNPLVFARGREQFVTPWWADVAVQGHAMGLLIGVLAGLAVARRRDSFPDARFVWLATLLFTASESLYALYWYLSGTEYVLFQAVGVAALLALAAFVAAAFARSDVALVSRIALPRRDVAAGVLLCVVLALALVAVPYNTVSVSPGPEADTGVQVRDYTVTYAEDVPNRYISAVEIPVLQDALTVESSGVIVTSDRRDAWEVVVPAGRLAVRRTVRVPVGGIGWRETVAVNRTGWAVFEGKNVYKVFARTDGASPERVFASAPANVSAVVNDSRIQIHPTDPGFQIAVRRNGSVVDAGPLPPQGTNATVGGLRFDRSNGSIDVRHDGTRFRIATEEPQTPER